MSAGFPIKPGQVFDHNRGDEYIIVVIGSVPDWYLIQTGQKEEPYWTKLTHFGPFVREDEIWLNKAVHLAIRYDVRLEMIEQ